MNTFNTDFALTDTNLRLTVTLDNHYEGLKINDSPVSEGFIDFVVTESCQFNLVCSPKTYTVDFILGGKGESIDSQIITYQHLITEPFRQYNRETNEIISGWSLDSAGTQI
jgi:hypothetical protein